MKVFLYLSLTLLFSFLNKNFSSAPCKKFPKLFGGLDGDTRSRVIDANLAKDIIIIAGKTVDGPLAGGNALFVATFSI